MMVITYSALHEISHDMLRQLHSSQSLQESGHQASLTPKPQRSGPGNEDPAGENA